MLELTCDNRYCANACMYATHGIAVEILSVCLSVNCVRCDKMK